VRWGGRRASPNVAASDESALGPGPRCVDAAPVARRTNVPASCFAIALGALLAFSLLRVTLAAPSKPPPGPPAFDAKGPPTTLASAPHLLRLRVDISPGAATIIHDLSFEKDDLKTVPPHGEPLVYFAFSAQERPLAVEIGKLAIDEAGATSALTPLAFDNVNAKPPAAALVLGSGKQAGHVARLPKIDGPFALRIRSAIALSPGIREVSLLARLGVRDGHPIPLGRIEIAGILGTTVRGARAMLCGPKADARPLRVTFPGYPDTADAGSVITPDAIARQVDDDLCLDVLF
jgi:hypothetical protein